MATFPWNDGTGQVITITPDKGSSNAQLSITSPQNPIPKNRTIPIKVGLDDYDKEILINVTQSPLGVGEMSIGGSWIVYQGEEQTNINPESEISILNDSTPVSTAKKLKTWLRKMVRR